MSITSVLRKSGSWTISFKDSLPSETLSAIDYFEHFAFVPGHVDVLGLGDQLLDMARYVGIVRNKDDISVGGIDMSGWLGDENQKGEVYETAVILTNATFPDAVRALLPEAVREGTLYTGVPGTITETFVYQDPRTAIDNVATTMGGSWRVNNDATLDAGLASDLYVTEPTAIIVSKNWGADMHMVALPGNIKAALDAKNYVTRVLLMGQGSGPSVAVGSADNPEVDYKDMFGNPVKRTQMVSLSTASPTNVNVQAQVALNTNVAPIRNVTLDTAEYDIAGDFHVGDMVWVYDPASGLYDLRNEVTFRGQVINPVAIQCIQLTIPILDGYTVAWRDKNGRWTDLTQYYAPETGTTTVEVADTYSTLLVSGAEAVQPRISTDTMPPAPPTISDITTESYLSGDGQTKARLTVSWNQPLNPDGSTVTDGNYYTVRYRVHGASTAYTYDSVAWATRTLTIGELSNGTEYDVSVEAVDLSANHSGYDADETVIASPDTTPPSTPAAPAVAGNPLSIQVTSTLGKASGGTYNLENDLAFLFVYASTTGTFTPSLANYVGRIPCGNGNLELEIPAIGSFSVSDGSTKFVKITAVDRSGNESLPSTAASATALLIDTINISNAAITDAKISNVSATKIQAGTIGAYTIILANGGIIESNGFTSGSVGWAIDGAGNAEFYNATVRGEFLSGTSSQPHIALGESGALEYIQFETASTNQVSAGHIYIWKTASGSHEAWALELKPPTVFNPDTDTPFIQAICKAADLSTLGVMTIGADGDTVLQLQESGGIFLQQSAGQQIFVGLDEIVISSHTLDDYVSITHTDSVTNTTYVSFKIHQNSGFTVPLIPNIAPSSTDVLMRYATSSGQLWYDSSSARFKHAIRDVEDTYDLGLIDQLRVVSYRETNKITNEVKPHDYIGYIAEEVAEVMPCMVTLDQNGDPLSVHHEKIGALVTAAVQDLRRRVAMLEGKALTVGKKPDVSRYPDEPQEIEFRLECLVQEMPRLRDLSV